MKFDATTAAMRQLVACGRQRGYVTVDEVNAAFPSDVVSLEVIEETLSTLSDEGINVVEKDDGPEDGEPAPRNPLGPLSPLPVQAGAEAPLEADMPLHGGDLSYTTSQTE
jgi:hypothetical protein